MTTRNGYSRPQILLHWIIAVLIAFNYLYSEGMGEALDFRLGDAASGATAADINPQVHVWVGVAVLLLSLARLILRGVEGVPEPGGQGAMQRMAGWGHRLLYLLMILVPLMGGLTWFGRIEALGDIHAVLANTLIVVALGHAAVAIFHQLVLRDNLIRRMTRPSPN